MNFGEAIEAMKQGKFVKRANWGGHWFLSKNPSASEQMDDGYTRSYGFQNDLIVSVLKDGGGCAPAQPYQGDILADDWEVLA